MAISSSIRDLACLCESCRTNKPHLFKRDGVWQVTFGRQKHQRAYNLSRNLRTAIILITPATEEHRCHDR